MNSPEPVTSENHSGDHLTAPRPEDVSLPWRAQEPLSTHPFLTNAPLGLPEAPSQKHVTTPSVHSHLNGVSLLQLHSDVHVNLPTLDSEPSAMLVIGAEDGEPAGDLNPPSVSQQSGILPFNLGPCAPSVASTLPPARQSFHRNVGFDPGHNTYYRLHYTTIQATVVPPILYNFGRYPNQTTGRQRSSDYSGPGGQESHIRITRETFTGHDTLYTPRFLQHPSSDR